MVGSSLRISFLLLRAHYLLQSICKLLAKVYLPLELYPQQFDPFILFGNDPFTLVREPHKLVHQALLSSEFELDLIDQTTEDCR